MTTIHSVNDLIAAANGNQFIRLDGYDVLGGDSIDLTGFSLFGVTLPKRFTIESGVEGMRLTLRNDDTGLFSFITLAGVYKEDFPASVDLTAIASATDVFQNGIGDYDLETAQQNSAPAADDFTLPGNREDFVIREVYNSGDLQRDGINIVGPNEFELFIDEARIADGVTLEFNGGVVFTIAELEANPINADDPNSLDGVIANRIAGLINGPLISDGDDIVNVGAAGGAITSSEGADQYTGVSNTSSIDYGTSDEGVTVSLVDGSVGSGGHAEGDVLTGIGSVAGSDFSDVLTGNTFGNFFEGRGGNDIIDGGGGAGVDIVAYGTSQRSDFMITRDAQSVVTVTDISDPVSGEGVDTLTNINALRFGDDLPTFFNNLVFDEDLFDVEVISFAGPRSDFTIRQIFDGETDQLIRDGISITGPDGVERIIEEADITPDLTLQFTGSLAITIAELEGNPVDSGDDRSFDGNVFSNTGSTNGASNAGDDIFNGDDSGTSVLLGAGDDQYIGSTTLEPGALNVARYASDREGLDIRRDASGGITITDIDLSDGLDEGTDTLTNVDALQFGNDPVILVDAVDFNTDPTEDIVETIPGPRSDFVIREVFNNDGTRLNSGVDISGPDNFNLFLDVAAIVQGVRLEFSDDFSITLAELGANPVDPDDPSSFDGAILNGFPFDTPTTVGDDIFNAPDEGIAIFDGQGDDQYNGAVTITLPDGTVTGVDTVGYFARREDFEITRDTQGVVTITDRVVDDISDLGTNTFRNFDQVQFSGSDLTNFDDLDFDEDLLGTNPDNTAPVFVPTDGNFGDPENTPGVSFSVAATDADENDIITYSIDGADAQFFNISDTGTVTLNSLLLPNGFDFEAASANGDDVYNFTVTATDLAGASATQDVRYTVSNVNEAPDARDDTLQVTAGETTTIDVAQLLDNDIDVDDNSNVNLRVSAVSDTGQDIAVSLVNNNTQIQIVAPFAGASSFTYTIEDQDGLSDTATVDVTMVDPDAENTPPVFVPTDGDFGDPENTPGVSFSVAATDADENDVITYSIDGADAQFFNISDDGTVTLNSLLLPNGFDFEAASANGDDVYNFTVTATDLAGASATQDVRYTVSNVNEAPDARDDTLQVTAGETTTIDVAQLLDNDIDVDDNSNVNLRVSAVSDTGQDIAVSLVNNNTQIQIVAPIAGASSFTYTIEDQDGLSDTATVDVTVVEPDVVNTPPVFVPTDGDFGDPENTPGVSFSVAATDADENDVITYSIDGADAQFFNISDDGTVTLNSLLLPNGFDFEAASANGDDVYNFTVTATDLAGASATQDVRYTVSNVNEAPDARDDTLQVTVGETTTIDVAQLLGNDIDVDDNSNVNLRVSAVSDTGQDIAVSLVNNNTQIQITAPTAGTSSFTYTVEDQAGLIDTATVDVTVVDPDAVNTPPVFLLETTDFGDPANTPDASFTAAAQDPGDTLTYQLSGADAQFFIIDPSTGVITLDPVQLPEGFDFEDPRSASGNNMYLLTVTATDTAGNAVSEAVTYTASGVIELNGDRSDFIIRQIFDGTTGQTVRDGISITGPDNVEQIIEEANITIGLTLEFTGGFSTTIGELVSNGVILDDGTSFDGTVFNNLETANNVGAVGPFLVSNAGDDIFNGPDSGTSVLLSIGDDQYRGSASLEGGASNVVRYLSNRDGLDIRRDATGVITVTDINPNEGTDEGVDILVNAGFFEFNLLAPGMVERISVDDLDFDEDLLNPDNTAPVFVPTDGDFGDPENTPGVSFSVAATDTDDGDIITYSIDGADAQFFNISDTGTVTLNSLLLPNGFDFEAASANGDDVYNFTVTATDLAGASATQDVRYTVSDVDETGEGLVIPIPGDREDFTIRQILNSFGFDSQTGVFSRSGINIVGPDGFDLTISEAELRDFEALEFTGLTITIAELEANPINPNDGRSFDGNITNGFTSFSPFGPHDQGDDIANVNPNAFASQTPSSAGADQYNGGVNSLDAVNYEFSNSGVTVNLAIGRGSGGHAEGDTFSNINSITGSRFNDDLTGDANDNVFRGGQGNDQIDGGAGLDTAFFMGLRDRFNVERDANGVITVTDTRSGQEGIDTLQNVEFLNFQGGISSVEGFDFDRDEFRGADADETTGPSIDEIQAPQFVSQSPIVEQSATDFAQATVHDLGALFAASGSNDLLVNLRIEDYNIVAGEHIDFEGFQLSGAREHSRDNTAGADGIVLDFFSTQANRFAIVTIVDVFIEDLPAGVLDSVDPNAVANLFLFGADPYLSSSQLQSAAPEIEHQEASFDIRTGLDEQQLDEQFNQVPADDLALGF